MVERRSLYAVYNGWKVDIMPFLPTFFEYLRNQQVFPSGNGVRFNVQKREERCCGALNLLQKEVAVVSHFFRRASEGTEHVHFHSCIASWSVDGEIDGFTHLSDSCSVNSPACESLRPFFSLF
ncbi:hypothetical protein SDC9_130727 [bioreactor metagenome]|uniref:Uncharacterized protein n=1 Tax=bioreactor metagenome TaxID=1076179 RepID=A0A645D3M1_9ZZZZ